MNILHPHVFLATLTGDFKKLWYNVSMINNTHIGKAVYGTLDQTFAHLQDYSRQARVIKKMKENGWLDCPLTPQDIPKASQVFKRKNSQKAKQVYAFLLAGAALTGGLIKIFNKDIAVHLNISVSQVERIIANLVQNRLIASLCDYFPGRMGRPRSTRIIAVWASWFVCRCMPFDIGPKLFNKNCKIENPDFEKARKRISLKFKIATTYFGNNVGGGSFSVDPEYVDWYYLEYHGVIDEEIRTEIEIFGNINKSIFAKRRKDKLSKRLKKSNSDKNYGIINHRTVEETSNVIIPSK